MSLRPQNNNYNTSFSQNIPQANSNFNVPFSGTIQSSLTPGGNQAMGAAEFNGKFYLFVFNHQYNFWFYKETIVSNNVEDLIDVMAKRRLAIKNLEVLINLLF